MAAVERAPMIDSGRVIGRGFRVVGDNFLPFGVAALLLTGLPSGAVQYWALGSMVQGQMADTFQWYYLGFWLLTWVLGALLQGTLVRATVLDLADQEMELGQCLVTALRLALPILAISILVFLGVVVGTLLLIVPGVMLYCALSVAVPALIEERAGVFGSIGRSYRLTRGSWLQIFVLLILYLIFWTAVSTVFSVAFGVQVFALDADNPAMAAICSALTATVTSTVGGVMIASLYIELRTVKEGATTDALASIFA